MGRKMRDKDRGLNPYSQINKMIVKLSVTIRFVYQFMILHILYAEMLA